MKRCAGGYEKTRFHVITGRPTRAALPLFSGTPSLQHETCPLAVLAPSGGSPLSPGVQSGSSGAIGLASSGRPQLSFTVLLLPSARVIQLVATLSQPVLMYQRSDS